MPVKKQIMILVYDSAGNYLNSWPTAFFSGFTKELNAGVGECVLTLPYAFDYTGQDLVEGNNVEIRISDFDTNKVGVAPGEPARIIYQGYISLIEPSLEGSKEGVQVHILGHYTKLSLDILKDTSGSATTLYSDTTTGITTTGPGTAADIGLMMRALITKYRAETTAPMINYLYDDIPNTGTNAFAVFRQLTYRDVMDKLRNFAPSGVYWYVDETGNVKFKPQPTTPTHKFYFGKHFSAVKVERSLEKLRNVLFLWNGEDPGVYKQYTDSASVTKYGRRAQTVNDYTIKDSTTADAYAAKFFAENKNPVIKLTCTIVDNNSVTLDADGVPIAGYDIESIQPGDTCSFYGFNLGSSDIFNDNMIITKVDYSLDKAVIEVEITKTGVLASQNDDNKKIREISANTAKIPATYT